MQSLFAFVLFFYIAECKHFRSDYYFHSEVNGWLKLHHIPATCDDARLRCRLEGFDFKLIINKIVFLLSNNSLRIPNSVLLGAVLASPSNTFIESAIQKEMKNQHISTGAVFTGIHATFSKGHFFSVEGIPLNDMQLQWMPNEPDNKNNDEECILYNANKTIADIRCSEIHPYICYKKNTSDLFVTGCGTVDKEYNLDTRTGKCYKFHKYVQNWTDAFMTCSAEGGHLAIINSATESDILKELLEKNVRNFSSISTHMKQFIHIGFHDLNEKGIWTTIHGTSLAEAGFELWKSGEPNNEMKTEYCGSMYYDGRLNDMYCSSLLYFICEKSPESLQNYY